MNEWEKQNKQEPGRTLCRPAIKTATLSMGGVQAGQANRRHAWAVGNRPNQNKSREPGPHNVHIIVK